MENNNNKIGFSSLLTLLFIGLKLANFIDWSWWWVVSPLFIGYTIGCLLILIALFLDRKK